jgi:ABC-2 type transport system permease protein
VSWSCPRRSCASPRACCSCSSSTRCSGIGLGALIKNQLGAIIVAVVWVFIVEALVNAIPALQPVGKWTPAGAGSAMINSGVNLGLGTDYLLQAWAGALVLLGYAVLFSAVASATTIRRDIT